MESQTSEEISLLVIIFKQIIKCFFFIIKFFTIYIPSEIHYIDQTAYEKQEAIKDVALRNHVA